MPIVTIAARITLLGLFLLTGLGPAGSVAQADARIADVTSAAIEQSRHLERGDLTSAYDGLHPDLRNRLPRHAFATWIAGAPTPVADPVVVGVRLTGWTSDVTGEWYSSAAIVTYTQDVSRNGVMTTSGGEWVFVEAGDRWRWFPGLTAVEIASLREVERGPSPGGYRADYAQARFVQIDRFWQAQFFAAGRQYVPLQIVVVPTASVETGCGRVTNVRQLGIFYCTHDAGIYVDPGFRDRIGEEFHSYAWTMIVVHEWSHHVQALLGIDLVENGESGPGYLELGLQADCLAAIYVQDSFARGQIGQDEVDAALAVIESAGDPAWVSRESRRAHGTAEERMEMFQAGFDNGFTGCGIAFQAA